MKKLSRKEREKYRHRSEILQVAETVFSKKGFYKSTMREIARKAEFATATIYKFFKNKEDLYARVILEKTDEFINFVKTEVSKETNIVMKVEKSIEAKVSFFLANVPFVKIYFAETRGGSYSIHVSLDKEIRSKYEDFLHFVAQLFSEGINDSTFVKVDPYDLSLALDGLTNAFLFFWLESMNGSKEWLLNKIPVIKKMFFEQVRLK
ncbi:MAG: TetR/AcrR family transcriptional regulator [Thermodesulfobacteriota bacterium]|nr:TetR/AcrR family transcriptional regulator [Thermodesulfobacteriota bacterium]